MKLARIIISTVVSISIVLLIVWRISQFSGAGLSEFPNQPIQVVVPYAAGGGTDVFARTLQKSINANENLPQPFVIINQPGGVGTIGSRFVLGSRPDGYRILCINDVVITTQLSGTVSYGPEDFFPIAQTGNMTTMVVVREDSPFDNLSDLLDEAEANPKSLRFGADAGSPAFFNAKVIERLRPGAEVNYISSGGGQKRITQLLGGHLDVAIFSIGEFNGYRASDGTPPDQNIKAIAVLDGERSRFYPDVPTATEQGIPIYSGNAYYWFAPKGTPSPVIERLAGMFERALDDPAVLAAFEQQSIGLAFRKGDALVEFLSKKKGDMGSFESEQAPEIPNFPSWVIGILLVLGLLIVTGKLGKLEADGAARSGEIKIALMAASIMILYIGCLQFGLPYGLVTTPALFLLGATLAGWKQTRM
ncbi:MAG: tripartite tricarboxylate transporter substrate binding protein, partial [Verrucomicrobiota bacterium]